MLMLSFHLRLGPSSGLLPLGFPTKILYAPHLTPYVLRPQVAYGGRPPGVQRSCEYIEYAVVDSQQEVVLQFGGLGEMLTIPRRKKLNRVTKQSQKPRNNETAVKKEKYSKRSLSQCHSIRHKSHIQCNRIKFRALT